MIIFNLKILHFYLIWTTVNYFKEEQKEKSKYNPLRKNHVSPLSLFTESTAQTNDGGKMLIINGYYYHLEKKDETYEWCCVERKSSHCKGRLSPLVEGDENKIIIEPNAYNHSAEPHTKAVIMANEKLKIRENHLGSVLPKLYPTAVYIFFEIKCSCRR